MAEQWYSLAVWRVAQPVSGVYAIRHQKSGREYVGKSLNVRDRLRAHFHAHTDQRLHRAIRRHGAQEFEFCVLHQDVPVADLCAKEIGEIAARKTYGKGFNDTLGGDAGWEGKRHRPESRRKMSEAKLLKNAMRGRITPEDVRLNIAESNLGKKRSSDTLKRMSESQVGKPKSAITAQRIRQANPRREVVLVWPVEATTPIEFLSIGEAARWAGVSRQLVTLWLTTERKRSTKSSAGARQLAWAFAKDVTGLEASRADLAPSSR